MIQKKIKLLFLKIFILSTPVLLLLALYLYYDPFRVLRKYDNYEKGCFVSLNRDFVSNEIYLKKNKERQYNAFIFGNSRSLAFLCSDWQQYIGANSSPFHYDASSETLKALTDKIKYIDSTNGKLDNALVILDRHLLALNDYLDGELYKPHPTLSNTSWFNYHVFYFKAFLAEFYFAKYMDYSLTRTYKPYMKGVIETRPIDYNAVTNDFFLKVYDEALEKDPQKYIEEHIEFYPARDTANTKISDAVIGDKQLYFLNEIIKVFLKQKTNFKIIISPPYDQEYLNKSDLEKLTSIFGKEHVYDFSGKNEYTRHIENYYESFHYRPKVARDIMQKIYSGENKLLTE